MQPNLLTGTKPSVMKTTNVRCQMQPKKFEEESRREAKMSKRLKPVGFLEFKSASYGLMANEAKCIQPDRKLIPFTWRA